MVQEYQEAIIRSVATWGLPVVDSLQCETGGRAGARRIVESWSGVVSKTAHALDDLRVAFAAKDESAREATVEKITDLFVAGASQFSEAHVALFDQVIGLLAEAIEIRARARLSVKLADIANAPPDLVRKLSRDEIVVARPVLARSPRLTDKDLMDAARHGGRDHMLAISERRDLSEPVTDVLVNEGDRVVVNAVASNPTARFSAKGYDALIGKSRADDLLQAALGRRNDIPQRHMAVLFELAKKAARERLQNDHGGAGRRAVSEAVNATARDIVAETRARSEAYKQAVQDVSGLMQHNSLHEPNLVEFARQGQLDHTVIALSYLSKLPLAMVERAVSSSDNDALLIIGRSINLSWTTVRLIFALRLEHKPSVRQLEQLSDSYGKLNHATAQRVLRFLHARESATAARP
jgi:uncharacterized protein (DUF2336 family)